MTRYLKNIILLAGCILSMALWGCDTVDENERFVLMPTVNTSDRTVLLEEFTGQFCSNCPAAHTVAAQLLSQYGHNFVTVSIHGGGFGFNEKYTDFAANSIGLATKEGEDYHKSAGIKAWPAGIVNRTSGVLTADAWATAVRNAITTPSEIGLVTEASIEGDSLKVDVTIVPGADVDGASLSVWVVENHIVTIQQDGANFLTDYEHNHVFRKALTPMPDGEEIAPLKIGRHASYRLATEMTNTATCRWNPENMGVVVFVATKSEGVLQAEYVEASCAPENENE